MPISRRKLLVDTTKVLAGLSATSILTFPVVTNASGTPEFLSLSNEQVKILSSLSREMFPHQSLDESYYIAVAQHIDQQLRKNKQLKGMVTDGLTSLDTISTGPWLGLSNADKQAVMKKIERDGFFGFVLNNSIDILYRHPDVWKLIGYEGSSIEHGGYLHRGFDDIDWLPQ